ncbi:iron chelate uptake ABC transporter family permease subunit [Rhodococcus artemisiae]|uniref:Iron chelate uptake ABC transporter family permease subunit n=2 Tax=Rhodococcus artemisiae TaxID=714159 RepID=A0ABU7LCM8_9NOCA|nr:iron chelate uptake ABC transporter family permease subunit [Rhodococcus artemisiae]MEE2059069.1 iron chelate uptake ABC transporter family permease subunit [Rhodococcus artemisiae]
MSLGRRRFVGLVLAIALLTTLLLVSLAVGSKIIPLSGVVDALVHGDIQGDAYVIWDMRIPRTFVGVVVGVAIGAAGALIQALTRNPLADPGILGVNAGAAFFVTLGVAVFGVSSIQGYVWFAFAGAFVVTVAVYLIGSAGRARADPIQLTLAGVALGAVLGGIVTAMVLLDPLTFDQMRNWNAGSIVNRGWDVALPVVPFLVVGLGLAACATPALNSIALGDDFARSLGTNVMLTRVVVVTAVTLLAGGATAVAGPIGFVGLMVPHIARWVVGPDQRWILAYTALLAPSLVLAADIVGRVLIRPAEFPVGIVTACIGAPVLIVLVRRKKVSGL